MKVALPGDGGHRIRRKPLAAGRDRRRRLEDGEAVGAVRADQPGDAGGVVGAVGLKLRVRRARTKPRRAEGIGDGVGLVAVGDDGVPSTTRTGW